VSPTPNDTLFTGSAPIYADDLRHVWDTVSEGVVGAATDFKVAAGATGLSIDVTEGTAYVTGDDDPNQANYYCILRAPVNSGSFAAGGIPAAHATKPRLDQIILHVYDDEWDGSGSEGYELEVLPGTATTGATLDNRTGAAALPNTAILLADVLVPAAATSIHSADIRDRRAVSSEAGGGGGALRVQRAGALPTPIFDDFSTNTIANYADILSGAGGSSLASKFAVAAGVLGRTAAGMVAFVHTSPLLADGIYGFKFHTDPSSPQNPLFIIRYIDDDHVLVGRWQSSQLKIESWRAGLAITVLATVAAPATPSNADRWFRGEIEGADVTLSIYSSDPAAGSPTPLAVATTTLAGVDLTAFVGVEGKTGAVDTTSTLFDDIIINQTLPGVSPTTEIDFDATSPATVSVVDAGAGEALVTVGVDLGAVDALVFKGVIDCSGNPNYPAANAGENYKVSVAGKIGGASGTKVEVGDWLLCTVDGSAAGTQAAVGANWDIIQANIDGAVVGPASATDSHLAQFDGTSGKLIKDGGFSFDTDTALGANSDLRFATQKATKAYADALGAAGLVLAPTTSARNTIQPTADVVPLTIKGKSGQTANLQEWRDSSNNLLFGVEPNGHGVFVDRPAGTPPDYASQLDFRLAGTTKWSIGLSIEQQDFFIYDTTSGNDIFTINAFDQVGIGAGTVTTTSDQMARLYVNADGLDTGIAVDANGRTALKLVQHTDDASHYAFVSQITGDTQPRFLSTASGGLRWGPGGSTAPDTILARTGVARLQLQGELNLKGTATTSTLLSAIVSGESQNRFTVRADGALKWGPGGSSGTDITLSRIAGPGLTIQPDTDGNAFSVLNQSAGSSVFLVDTSANVVRVKALTTTVNGATIDLSADSGAAQSIVAGTSNGLKIGTAASQKLGFFNATPVVQASAYTNSSGLAAARTLPASFTMNDLAKVVIALMTDSHNFGFSA
jgi:hypothetical protein